MAKSGFVYIMINPSVTPFLKIGRTSAESERRTKELNQIGAELW